MQRVAIVTGSNKGIGFAAVKALSEQFKGGVVYLTSRDEKRGRNAVEKLKKETGLDVCYHQLDITDSKSCCEFVEAMKKAHGGVDVVINNAAIAFKRDATEPFGVQAEQTLATNFFATDRFCQAIFPLLRPHARVVNVSSSAGHLSVLRGGGQEQVALRQRLADPDIPRDEMNRLASEFVRSAKEGSHRQYGWIDSAYSVSKVLVAVLTRVQQRELDNARPGEDILVNSVHPGYVDTDMTSHKGPLSPEEGAQPLVYCALLPEGEKTLRGGFVWYDKRAIDFAAATSP